MFSSNIDVIHNGYYPLADMHRGTLICTQSLPILPLQLFPSNGSDLAHFSWWGAPLFSCGCWTADPLSKAPLRTRLNVLFMTPVEHSKPLNRNQNKTPQLPQENHFPCWNKTLHVSVAGVFRCSYYETTTLGQLNPFLWLQKDMLMHINPSVWLKIYSYFLEDVKQG